MQIGILYESKEWSSYALERYINELGVSAKLIDMEQYGNDGEIAGCEMIVNRVYASAQFRGHHKSLRRMPAVLESLRRRGVPVLNPCEAHFYETDKALATNKLAEHGFSVPEVYGVFTPAELQTAADLKYPCVVKPNCGGRTNYTFILHGRQELERERPALPDIRFLAETYIPPQYGFLTRIEVIGGECRLILKRSVAANGLSAYHLGSTYARYPECGGDVRDAAVRAMDLLRIESGSMDIIENDSGFYIIDVNSVSNASEDNTEMFSFDLMRETAAYAVEKYRRGLSPLG